MDAAQIETMKALALAAPEIRTWQQRMPRARTAWRCEMNCSPRDEGQACGDCLPVKVYGDPVAARDAEIADLRAEVERLRAELAAGAARQGGGTSADVSVINYGNPVDNFAAPAAGTDKENTK